MPSSKAWVELTDQQRATLEAVRVAVERDGRAPTLVELAKAVGMKASVNADTVLTVLQRKGYLMRTAGAARGIVLLKDCDGNPLHELR